MVGASLQTSVIMCKVRVKMLDLSWGDEKSDPGYVHVWYLLGTYLEI